MAKRSRGTLSSHTRGLYKRKSLTINDYIKDIKEGDKVAIDPHPVYRGAMPHMRYKGKVGIVSEARGKSYVVEIMDGGIRKKIISSPIHIRKV
jgi:large subunit ribosomal protein L21e